MATENKVNPCRSCPYKASEYCLVCISNPSRRTGKDNNPWSEYYISDEERDEIKRKVNLKFV